MKKKILVIEDRKDSASMIQESLENIGYKVNSVSSAEDGSIFIQKSKPDLIILDLMLPGESGLSFFERVKSDPKNKAIKIVIMTASKLDDTEKNYFLENGANEFLHKPIKIKSIREIIKNLLK
jgi:two-component system, OmpR family, alkaline phosphatase synthesis response regulator PhoP